MPEHDLVVYEPIGSLSSFRKVRTVLEELRNVELKSGTDYGPMPGSNKEKLVLLKPGGEKIISALHLRPEFRDLSVTEDFDTGLFHYRMECTLVQIETGYAIATGQGSCNSFESKYRYRYTERVCPNCSQPLRKSKQRQEYYCWAKLGGCGATFPLDDAEIAAQTAGKVSNPDPADLVNTINKMAAKRAFLAAVLMLGASEWFASDTGDDDEVEGAPPAQEEKPQTGEKYVGGSLESGAVLSSFFSYWKSRGLEFKRVLDLLGMDAVALKKLTREDADARLFESTHTSSEREDQGNA